LNYGSRNRFNIKETRTKNQKKRWETPTQNEGRWAKRIPYRKTKKLTFKKMKKYSLKEIKEIWRRYKLPSFTSRTDNFASDELKFEPGMVHPAEEVKEIYRYEDHFSFPEYLEYLEDLETERKIKKLQE